MGNTLSQTFRSNSNPTEIHRHYVYCTGKSGFYKYPGLFYGSASFTPDAPMNMPKDILCTIDVKAQNIREIKVICGGIILMHYTFPEGTHRLDAFNILGTYTEIPLFQVRYHDIYLDIVADTSPEVTTHTREPTDVEKAETKWEVTLPECPANTQGFRQMVILNGMVGCKGSWRAGV